MDDQAPVSAFPGNSDSATLESSSARWHRSPVHSSARTKARFDLSMGSFASTRNVFAPVTAAHPAYGSDGGSPPEGVQLDAKSNAQTAGLCAFALVTGSIAISSRRGEARCSLQELQ